MSSPSPSPERLQEVELRALLLEGQQQTITAIMLGEFALLSQSSETIRDTYFCPNSATSMDDIPMSSVGDFGLRIRQTSFNGVEGESSINAKVITQDDDHGAWDEHETTIGDPKEMAGLLEIMGFKPFFVYEKNRLSYQFYELTMAFDEIPGYGVVLELEKMIRREDAEKAKKNLGAIMNFVGVSPDQIIEKTATYELMVRNARF